MLKKYGKFYARWTGLDRKRHAKACPTMKAARRLQNREQAKTAALKKAARPARPSPPSAGR
jgi:hypothetical protein